MRPFLPPLWFVYDPEMDTILAPLEHSSIDKMLTRYCDNGVLAPIAHSVAVIETSLREYWFYGREVFENRRKYFQSLVEHLQLEDWVRESTFPTWEELRDAHAERSKHLKVLELSDDDKKGLPLGRPDFLDRLALEC